MYYYVGLNEERIGNTKIFNGSVTIIGSNRNNNYAYNKIYNKTLDYNDISKLDEMSKFYSEYMWKIIDKDPDAKFMFYSLVSTSKFDNELISHIVCNNTNEINAILNNKIECRKMLESDINLLQYKYLKGNEISYSKICELLPNYKRYVVQQPFGFAGYGTHLITKENYNTVQKMLNNEVLYSISGYEENAISINNTFLISNNKILIFPGSYQIITIGDQLNYDGYNFEGYQNLSKTLKTEISQQTYRICKKLQKIGYRGIGGVDYIIKDNKIYFMEINPRFQASSTKLNDILIDKGYPDIYTLNLNSFYNEDKLPFEIKN